MAIPFKLHGVISKEKYAASSREIAGELRRLPTLIETLTVYDEDRTLDKHPYS